MLTPGPKEPGRGRPLSPHFLVVSQTLRKSQEIDSSSRNPEQTISLNNYFMIKESFHLASHRLHSLELNRSWRHKIASTELWTLPVHTHTHKSRHMHLPSAPELTFMNLNPISPSSDASVGNGLRCPTLQKTGLLFSRTWQASSPGTGDVLARGQDTARTAPPIQGGDLGPISMAATPGLYC